MQIYDKIKNRINTYSSKKIRIIIASILAIITVIAVFIIYGITKSSRYISMPSNPKIVLDEEDVFIPRSLEQEMVEYCEFLVEYYNGIVEGKYSMNELPAQYYQEFDDIEDSMHMVSANEKEYSQLYLSVPYLMIIRVDLDIQTILTNYEYREIDEEEAQNQLKNKIEGLIKEMFS